MMNIQLKRLLYRCLSLGMLVALVPSSTMAMLTFQNGGFEGYTGNTNSFNSAVPPGWTTTGGTPDTFSGDTDFAGFTWAPSTNGGDFLHGIGDDPGYVESALQIGLEGLEIGKIYEISFEQAISRSVFSDSTSGYWEIVFGAESQFSDPMVTPDFGVFEGWVFQEMFFTATSTIQTLEVIARSTDDNLRADIGIDGFFLGDPGGNPDNPNNPPDDDMNQPVPEAGTMAMLGLGLLGIGAAARRKRS